MKNVPYGVHRRLRHCRGKKMNELGKDSNGNYPT